MTRSLRHERGCIQKSAQAQDSPPPEHEITFFVACESRQGLLAIAQQHLNSSGCAVPQPHPDHLRRSAHPHTALVEVRVLCHNHKSKRFCVLPHISVIRGTKPTVMNVLRIRISINQRIDQLWATGSRQTVTSRSHRLQLPLAVSRKCKASPDVFFCQVRKVRQYLRMRHSRRQILQYIPHGHTKPTDTRLPAALTRLPRDDLRIVHTSKVSQTEDPVKRQAASTQRMPGQHFRVRNGGRATTQSRASAAIRRNSGNTLPIAAGSLPRLPNAKYTAV